MFDILIVFPKKFPKKLILKKFSRQQNAGKISQGTKMYNLLSMKILTLTNAIRKPAAFSAIC